MNDETIIITLEINDRVNMNIRIDDPTDGNQMLALQEGLFIALANKRARNRANRVKASIENPSIEKPKSKKKKDPPRIYKSQKNRYHTEVVDQDGSDTKINITSVTAKTRVSALSKLERMVRKVAPKDTNWVIKVQGRRTGQWSERQITA